VRGATIAIVALGLLMAITLGFAQGFDATSVTILAATAAVGALAIAAVNRSTRGVTRPATCEECGGVISPHAPFCKHCGARRTS
jgi:hypothetical protein